jgi:hypothetical protein
LSSVVRPLNTLNLPSNPLASRSAPMSSWLWIVPLQNSTIKTRRNTKSRRERTLPQTKWSNTTWTSRRNTLPWSPSKIL